MGKRYLIVVEATQVWREDTGLHGRPAITHGGRGAVWSPTPVLIHIEPSSQHKEVLNMCKNTLAAALKYAALGYRVLPCHSIINGHCTCGGKPGCKPGKHPLTQHGVKDATTDETTIKSWWAQWPYANVAIATGGRVWVLDEDPRHGGDKTLADLIARHGALPLTPTVRTGGGGRQYFLFYRQDVVIRSRAGVAQGLYARGDSGYVIAPPSTHESGNRYEWLTPIETPLADAPDWLLAIVAETPAARGVAASSSVPSSNAASLTLTMQAAEPCDFASIPEPIAACGTIRCAASWAFTSAEATARRRWSRWLWRGRHVVTLRYERGRCCNGSSGRRASGRRTNFGRGG